MIKRLASLLFASLFITTCFSLISPKALATSCYVTSTADSGTGSLRECITNVNANCQASNQIRFRISTLFNNGTTNVCVSNAGNPNAMCKKNPGGESQSIENGNSLTYQNGSSSELVYRIGINSTPLPAITCGNTIIDGGSDGVKGPNSDCLGSGNGCGSGSGVGVNKETYSQIRRPLIEIGNDIGPTTAPSPVRYNCPQAGTSGYETYGSGGGQCSYTWGLRVKADNVTIKNLAIYNFFVNIQTVSTQADRVENLVVEGNLIGTSARRLKDNSANTPDGPSPAFFQEKYTWRNAFGVSVGNAANVIIRDNIFNWNFYGVSIGTPGDDPWNGSPSYAFNPSQNIEVLRNEFLFNGPGRHANSGSASQLFDYSPTQTLFDSDNIQFTNTQGFKIKNNFIHDTVSSGPTSWYPSRVNYNASGVSDPTGVSTQPQGKGIHIAFRNSGGEIQDNTIVRTTQAGIGALGSNVAGTDLYSVGVDILRNKILKTEDAVGTSYGSGQGIVLRDTTTQRSFGFDIRSNSFSQNVGIAVDLGDNGKTANDAGDGDIGENGFLNFPQLSAQPTTCTDLINYSPWLEFNGVTKENAGFPNSMVQVFEVQEDVGDLGNGEGRTFIAECEDNSSCDLNNTIGTVRFLAGVTSAGRFTATTSAWQQGFNSFGVPVLVRSTSEFSDNFTATFPAGCVPSPTPLPWFRLQDASLLTSGNISNVVPSNATGYSDNNPDTTVVKGEAGAVVVGGSTDYGSGQVSSRGWQISGYNQVDPSAALTQNKIQSLVDTILAKKTYTEITVGNGTDFSAITSDGVYYVSTGQNVIINDSNAGVFTGKKVVLVVKGSVFIVKSSGDFLPDNLVIIATGGSPEQSAINIDRTITELRGVYVSPIFDTGSSNFGLRVRGSIIATVLRLRRNNANNNKPGLMVEFDPAQFINALPYVGGNRYRWSEGQ